MTGSAEKPLGFFSLYEEAYYAIVVTSLIRASSRGSVSLGADHAE
jgi:hypothetical protein